MVFHMLIPKYRIAQEFQILCASVQQQKEQVPEQSILYLENETMYNIHAIKNNHQIYNNM